MHSTVTIIILSACSGNAELVQSDIFYTRKTQIEIIFELFFLQLTESTEYVIFVVFLFLTENSSLFSEFCNLEISQQVNIIYVSRYENMQTKYGPFRIKLEEYCNKS